MASMEEQSVIDALCVVDLPEETFTVTRQGKEHELVVRALTHDEALSLAEYSKKEDVTNAQYEQKMLALALVYPKMSTGQVKAWQKSSKAGEINGLVKLVQNLSGMGEESAKDAYKSAAGEPEPGE